MPRSLALLLAATVPLAGCLHTTLGAPPPNASFGERAGAYQQLRKSGEVHTITVHTGEHGTSVTHELDMVLANGETVRHADDLLPVVAPDSAAARSARRSAAARGKKVGWMLAGTAIMAAGVALALSGIDEQDDPAEGMSARMKYGFGVAGAGSLAVAIGGFYYRHVEHTERRAAFANYDDGLRARLALCVDGMTIVDCDAPAPADGPPGATPFSLRMNASPR